MRDESLRFLKDIAETPSPSGCEEAVAELFRAYVAPFADSVSTDVSGNVIAALNPQGSMKVMLAGHMDEIGFIIHYISEYGLLHFGSVGGNDGSIAVGQRVWVKGRKMVPGVIGYKAVHMMEPAEVSKKPRLKELWIDIGATSKEEAEELVGLGDTATLDNGFQLLAGNRAAARAFDNKGGLFVVAEALRLLAEGPRPSPDVAVFAVATVQEEIGSRGAQTAAHSIGPQTALAVDMGQAKDYPGIIKRHEGEFEIGKGPGISKGANTNPKVFELLTRCAQNENTPYQVTVAAGTSPTDERQIQVARSGVATGLIEIPLRYMHTPSEVISLADLENGAKLMAAYCRCLTADTDFTPRK